MPYNSNDVVSVKNWTKYDTPNNVWSSDYISDYSFLLLYNTPIPPFNIIKHVLRIPFRFKPEWNLIRVMILIIVIVRFVYIASDTHFKKRIVFENKYIIQRFPRHNTQSSTIRVHIPVQIRLLYLCCCRLHRARCFMSYVLRSSILTNWIKINSKGRRGASVQRLLKKKNEAKKSRRQGQPSIVVCFWSNNSCSRRTLFISLVSYS